MHTYKFRRQYKQLTGRSLAWPWSLPRRMWDDAMRGTITKGAHRRSGTLTTIQPRKVGK